MNIKTLTTLHNNLSAEERGRFYKEVFDKLYEKRRQKDMVLNLTGLPYSSAKHVQKMECGMPVYLLKNPNVHDRYAISAYLDEECTQHVGWVSRGGGTLFPQAQANHEVYRKIIQKEKFILAYPFKSGYYITKSLSNQNTLGIMKRDEITY